MGTGPFHIYRYDVTAGTFHDCGLSLPASVGLLVLGSTLALRRTRSMA